MGPTMPKKSTTPEFITKSIKVHGGTYDYSSVNYTGNMDKVLIICELHGMFLQTPKEHLDGCGCPTCGSVKAHKAITHTKEIFIKKAVATHGGRYDYSKVIYKKSSTKVKILCKQHGIFLQNPTNHTGGEGCPSCGRISTTTKRTHTKEQFVTNAINTHGDRYDYSKVVYINGKTKVVIACKEHGDFKQQPENHLEGKGCPICARVGAVKNFKSCVAPNRPTILYYFKHNPTNTFKLGITSVGYDKRYKRKLRAAQTLLWFSEIMPRNDAEELEEFLQDEFKDYRTFNHKYRNNGGTEFFTKDILNIEGENR